MYFKSYSKLNLERLLQIKLYNFVNFKLNLRLSKSEQFIPLIKIEKLNLEVQGLNWYVYKNQCLIWRFKVAIKFDL